MNKVTQYASNKMHVLYPELLKQVQKAQTEALWELSGGNVSEEERKEKVMAFIVKQIKDKNINYPDLSELKLAEKLYNDIEQYSILTEYLIDDNVEGFNINSWEDIRVTYVDGHEIKAEPFISPEHCVTIMKRLLQNSNVTIDEAIPMAEGSIGSNIRITTVMTPIVDEKTGVSSYVRKLRDKVFTDEEYLEKDFVTNIHVLKSIQLMSRRGVSTLIFGKVNTGKTTLVKHLLYNMPNRMQIVTIESGAREMDLVKRDKDGNILNNVVHMLTREHEDEKMNITQEKLVVKALRLNPDILSVAEMRDTETYAAIEASNSGHVVISTVHSGNFQHAHRRIANLSRKKYATDFNTALMDSCTAFPLGVFIHTTEDGIRRIMNISECYIEGKDDIRYRTLWEYQIEDNIVQKDGTIKVVGEYVHVNDPSEYLITQMKMYGITRNELKSLMKKEK